MLATLSMVTVVTTAEFASQALGQMRIRRSTELPVVVYLDNNQSQWNLRYCSSIACDATHQTIVYNIAPSCSPGSAISMQVTSNDLPLVLCKNSTNLFFNKCNTPSCTAVVTTNIDATTDATAPALLLLLPLQSGGDVPVMAYYRSSDNVLIYCICNNLDCTSTTKVPLTPPLTMPTTWTPRTLRMALTSQGNPTIVHTPDVNRTDMFSFIIACANPLCTSFRNNTLPFNTTDIFGSKSQMNVFRINPKTDFPVFVINYPGIYIRICGDAICEEQTMIISPLLSTAAPGNDGDFDFQDDGRIVAYTTGSFLEQQYLIRIECIDLVCSNATVDSFQTNESWAPVQLALPQRVFYRSGGYPEDREVILGTRLSSQIPAIQMYRPPGWPERACALPYIAYARSVSTTNGRNDDL